MKLTTIAVLFAIFSTSCFGAKTNVIGNLTYSSPDGWSTDTKMSAEDPLPTVTLRHGTDALAMTLISQEAESLETQEQLDQFLKQQARPIEQGSVEGRTTAQHLGSVPGLLCSYASHTDKALVNRPATPDNWKYTTMGFARAGNSLLHFTYFTNDRRNLTNGKPLAIIKTLRLQSVASTKATFFSLDLPENGVRISVPEIPQIVMQPHPLRKSHPHLRHQGSELSYNLSIITPTIDQGMTAAEFADARVKQLSETHGLSKQHYRMYRQPGNGGFSMFYVLPAGKLVLLHAHLFSVSSASARGIEVHISRTDTTKEGITTWLAGFPKAKIKKSSQQTDGAVTQEAARSTAP